MVGIDGSEKSMEPAEYAISIAKMYNAELTAINVLTSDIGYICSSPGIESPPIREIILLAEDEAKNGLIKLRQQQIEIKSKLEQSLLWPTDPY
jgi:nucleotide-binding universal stress UspA family protein